MKKKGKGMMKKKTIKKKISKKKARMSGKYVDGFIIPVPRKKLVSYLKLAKVAAKVWIEHGALEYVETVADDVRKGEITSFPQAVKLKAGEVVVFAWVVYKSRAHRDQVLEKVMNDSRLGGFAQESLPFDGMRMIWGGFKPIVVA